MTRFFKNSLFLLSLTGILFLVSCTKDDPALPDNLVAFESDQLGTAASETQLTITINLSRSVSTLSTVNILLEPTGVAYGTDFTTEPAAVSNTIALTVPANATTVSFVIKKTAGVLFDGDEKIKFTIQSVANGLVVGEKNVLTLSFAEIVASQGSMTITGGGPTFPNKVFIDLSGNRQTSIARTTWDLALSSTDDYRVVLNSPNAMMAYVLTAKTDLNTVTAADTIGLGAKVSLDAIFAASTSGGAPPSWATVDALTWIDDVTGDLTKTAIASVSATASENKVYIINRGYGPGSPKTKLGWKKVRIIRNGSNYTVQHADIGSSSFTETTITKNTAYRFNYFSFASGSVTIEPAKTKWDIAWGGFTNLASFGPGVNIPYYNQDIIVQSESVKTVEVLTATTAYDNFTEANLVGLTFAPTQLGQLAIGSKWRTLPQSGTAFVNADRYYIIKDPDGNYYKLRFTALLVAGQRGTPQFEFKLVKKA